MSYLDTPEFREKRDAMRVASGVSRRRFARELLEADSEAAAAAPVSETMSPEDFTAKLMSDRAQDGEADDGTGQDDHAS